MCTDEYFDGSTLQHVQHIQLYSRWSIYKHMYNVAQRRV